VRAPNGALRDFAELWAAGKPTYDPARIRASTLLIVGEWDVITPPIMAQTLYARLTQAAERRLVLLVDDHPTNRAVIARQLALAGYASETAEDGEQGLACWRTGRYALVLSDVHMPKLDGYQLAHAIREEEAREARPRTPIVALTASALKGMAERCFAAGMDDFLAKPVGIPALSATLARWLPPFATQEGAVPQVVVDVDIASPVDVAVLDSLTGGDPVETRALLDDFLASTAADLAAIDAARHDGALAAVCREAHKLKGAARLVGANTLGDAADRLETAARAQDVDAIATLAAEVAAAAAGLARFVDARWPH
jgi:CheY-like chemotaxis protein/HPt (histidine-containing phosphotransfer) domain-containing protein